MSTCRVPEGEIVFRHSVFPGSFTTNSRKQFVLKGFFYLKDRNGTLVTSLAWGRHLPSHADIHSYGCRLAARRNSQRHSDGTFRKEKQEIYCGAFQMRSEDIYSLAGMSEIPQIQSVDILHEIEHDEIAHANLKIALNTERSIEGTKTAILAQLWNVCSGPLRHVCPCDIEIANHPSTNLEVGPNPILSFENPSPVDVETPDLSPPPQLGNTNQGDQNTANS